LNTAVYDVTFQNFSSWLEKCWNPQMCNFMYKPLLLLWQCCSRTFSHLSFLLIQLSYRSSKHIFLQRKDKRCLPF